MRFSYFFHHGKLLPRQIATKTDDQLFTVLIVWFNIFRVTRLESKEKIADKFSYIHVKITMSYGLSSLCSNICNQFSFVFYWYWFDVSLFSTLYLLYTKHTQVEDFSVNNLFIFEMKLIMRIPNKRGIRDIFDLIIIR